MAEDSFYVTLPSGNSLDVFPQNNLANYITQFKTPLALTGSWEVGLSEIHVPNSWYNVVRRNNHFYVYGTVETYKDQLYDVLMFHRAAFRLDMEFEQGVKYTRLDYYRQFDNKLRERYGKIPLDPFLGHDWEGKNANFSPAIMEDYINITYKANEKKDQPDLININLKHGWGYLYDASYTYSASQMANLSDITGVPYDNLRLLIYNIKSVPEKEEMYIEPYTYEMFNHYIYVVPPYDDWNKLYEANPKMTAEDIAIRNEGLLHRPEDYPFTNLQTYFPTTREADTILGGHKPMVRLITLKGVKFERKQFSVRLKEGYYSTKQLLVDALNDAIPYPHRNYVFFKYIATLGLIEIQSLRKRNYQIKFPKKDDGLGLMLGFDEILLDENLPGNSVPGRIIRGTYPIDINRGVYNFFIYSDIVSQQRVGDTQANLLKIVNVAQSDSIVNDFSHSTHYKPLAKNNINTIQIVIKTDSDEEVRFTQGKTICVLHFRKQKYKKQKIL